MYLRKYVYVCVHACVCVCVCVYTCSTLMLSVCIARLSFSDGMSRSGVFITCMTEIERVKVEGGVDIFQTVKAARAQRPHMVYDSVSYCLQVASIHFTPAGLLYRYVLCTFYQLLISKQPILTSECLLATSSQTRKWHCDQFSLNGVIPSKHKLSYSACTRDWPRVPSLLMVVECIQCQWILPPPSLTLSISFIPGPVQVVLWDPPVPLGLVWYLRQLQGSLRNIIHCMQLTLRVWMSE